MRSNHSSIEERFEGPDLDSTLWFPYYLPHWSSRADSRANYVLEKGELHLTILPEQSLWCPDLHETPLRVSCIQTGSYSGPPGSYIGQQPFREGLVVREEQPEFRGYTPHYGQIEVRMRMTVTPGSMTAFWLVGFEDQAERSGEICVAEVFGNAIEGGAARIGMGIHEFRDPNLKEAFSTIPLQIDVSDYHTYSIDWRPGSVAFMVDGVEVHRLGQSPDYPMQLMLGVFDFPASHAGNPETPAAELIVAHLRGRPYDIG